VYKYKLIRSLKFEYQPFLDEASEKGYTIVAVTALTEYTFMVTYLTQEEQ
jgi:hypothetical protein